MIGTSPLTPEAAHNAASHLSRKGGRGDRLRGRVRFSSLLDDDLPVHPRMRCADIEIGAEPAQMVRAHPERIEHITGALIAAIEAAGATSRKRNTPAPGYLTRLSAPIPRRRPTVPQPSQSRAERSQAAREFISDCPPWPQTAVDPHLVYTELSRSLKGPARVKTCASQESVEPFSLLPSSDSRCQHFWFSD